MLWDERAQYGNLSEKMMKTCLKKLLLPAMAFFIRSTRNYALSEDCILEHFTCGQKVFNLCDPKDMNNLMVLKLLNMYQMYLRAAELCK